MRTGISRSQALLAAAVLVVVLALVAVAASGGGDDKGDAKATTAQPASAGAPADQQIDRLEQIVRESRTP